MDSSLNKLVMSYNRFEDPDHIAWARAVKKRDLFTCQICNATEVYLHSHHLNSFDYFVEERFDVSNGITLCENCHIMFHDIYGHGRNTKYQFQEFKDFLKVLDNVFNDISNDI